MAIKKFSDMVKISENNRKFDMICPKEVEKEAEALFKRYDVRANYIEDGAQYREAVRRNEEIIRELKELGVTYLSYEIYAFLSDEKIRVTLIDER